MNTRRVSLVCAFPLSIGWGQSSNAAECSYKVTNSWSSGFTGEISIRNSSATAVHGWTVQWAYANSVQLTNVWNASYSGSNPFVASDAGWNATIQPNQTITFGFNAMGPATTATVTGAVCTGASSSSSSSSSSGAMVNPEPFTYRFVWLIPTDKRAEYDGELKRRLLDRMNGSVELTQAWLWDNVGFSIRVDKNSSVEVIYGAHDTAWYETTGDLPRWNGLDNAISEVLTLNGTFRGDSTHPYRYVIWTNFESAGGANGPPNFVVLGALDIATLQINDLSADSWTHRQVGGLLHEIGHTLGLDHEGPSNDVMMSGYLDFDNAVLSEGNAQLILNNPAHSPYLDR